MRATWLLLHGCRCLLVAVLTTTVVVYWHVLSNDILTSVGNGPAESGVNGAKQITGTPRTTRLPYDDTIHDAELTDYNSIGPDCACSQKPTAHLRQFYDFCYRLPENRTVVGKRFSCDNLRTAGILGLLDRKKSQYLNLSTDTLPQPKFVTAFSNNHYGEGKRLIAEIQRLLPAKSTTIVVYDLGLTSAQVTELKRMCRVVYKKFQFEGLPGAVRNLGQFRWKPIVIAEALAEYGAVWYMDSSVKIKKSDVSHVYPLLTCRKNRTYTPPPFDPAAVRDNGSLPLEHSWHRDWWTASIADCDKYAYMLHGWTGHGIYPATHPGVYTYLPSNPTALQTKAAKMYEAGFVLVVRTREVIRDVLKWYVLCALEDGCMAPPHSSVGCHFPADRFTGYVGCHRFDQSVINLLLANVNNYDRYYWTSQVVDFFNIVRGAGAASPQMCDVSSQAPDADPLRPPTPPALLPQTR